MRLSLILLCCSAAGVLGGGALISLVALGGCLIFVALCAGAWAMFRDDGKPQAAPHGPPTLDQVLDRSRMWSTWDEMAAPGAWHQGN